MRSVQYLLSQNGLEWPNGTPPLAKKWEAWKRNRSMARSQFRRRLPAFLNEPRAQDFLMPGGRMHFAEAHWLWFRSTFLPFTKNRQSKMVGADLIDRIDLDDSAQHSAQCDTASPIERLLFELRATGRFAPAPIAWHDFYNCISHGFSKADGPPLPRILSAHFAATPEQKHETLREELIWSAENGRLGAAVFYLRCLSDDAWQISPRSNWANDEALSEEDFPASGTGRLLQQRRRLQANLDLSNPDGSQGPKPPD